jgi:hypothetical protein
MEDSIKKATKTESELDIELVKLLRTNFGGVLPAEHRERLSGLIEKMERQHRAVKSGGRPRKYATASDRTMAWKRRKKKSEDLREAENKS